MSADHEMRAVSARIEALVADLEALPDIGVRSRVEELVRLLLRLQSEGLARMLAVLEDRNLGPGEALERFAADPVVASLLMLHDLHPHNLPTRIGKALELLRPNLGARAELTLLEVSDHLVRVRLEVAPSGCGTPDPALRAAVDAAIRDAVPDVRQVEVEVVTRAPAPAIIQIVRPRAPATP
jgi:Fe-S cluster biogenesis protein NfuA